MFFINLFPYLFIFWKKTKYITPFFQEQTKSQDEAFENSHEALQSVVKISPLAAHTAILIYGKSCMPFMMTPFTHMHTNYISNLLKITKYLPNERVSILTLVIDRLVQLDAHLPIGEDLYDFDDRYRWIILISKCPSGVFKSTQKKHRNFWRISALTS